MGAWGLLNFENDTALDFVSEIEENSNGIGRIRSAIDIINTTTEDSYLDSDLCIEALAAIEYIAAAKDQMAEDFPENAEEWLQPNKASLLGLRNIIAQSKQAIDRIKHNSELKELWEETEDFEKWNKVLDDLNTRISS
jgi:methyl-accepting chemotaxis protein